ncbi:MAG: J domain-containing protein [Clostridia bacterium]|nr:J domain-containing protein [Clostridia bacterium]
MDPYKVLGVSPTASDDEIKQAYRALAKKYHPDNYVNNPIADLAAEKMTEINTAYETIQKMRSGQSTGNSGQTGGYRSATTPQYATIRNYISSGNLDAADALLEQISDRVAEWYFLKGSICYRRGWLDQAQQYFQQAAAMDPMNPEYAAANRRFSQMRGVYRDRGNTMSGGNGMNACDCCQTLLCADCCCECMGGDLISCC